jgi:RNA polymerase sigma factor (TIGR02999 family)
VRPCDAITEDDVADHPSPDAITEWLVQYRGGQREALDRLVPVLYDELHAMAARVLRLERAGHTLGPTALVNEVYLRLVGQRDLAWQNRAHFRGVAASVMRHVLVDHARKRLREKRGGGELRVSLAQAEALVGEENVELVALDEALERLREIDEQQSRVVELRYFGGLSIEETAEVMGVSPMTVKREWTMARAWLHAQLRGGGL